LIGLPFWHAGCQQDGALEQPERGRRGGTPESMAWLKPKIQYKVYLKGMSHDNSDWHKPNENITMESNKSVCADQIPLQLNSFEAA
jgi:hypothetical protein